MTDSDATQGDNMSPAQFAKLMGAYPQPAENPLPTYGGYMDNSAANFSWVQNNDYFGAESKGNKTVMCDFCSEKKPLGQMKRMPYDPEQNKRVRYSGYLSTYAICNGCYRDRMKGKPVGKSVLHAESFNAETFEAKSHTDGDGFTWKLVSQKYAKQNWKNEEIYWLDTSNDTESLIDEDNYENYTSPDFSDELFGMGIGFEAESDYFGAEDSDYDDYLNELEEDALVLYKDNPSHLFEKAYPIDYEVGMNDYESSLLADIQSGYTENSKMFDEDENLTPYGERVLKEMYDSLIDEALGIEWLASKHPPSELLKRGDPMAYRVGLSEYQDAFLGAEAETFNGLSAEEYYAEMEELTDGVASITNRFGDGVGIIQVDDEDLEDVSVEITDGDGDVVYEGILGDEDTPEIEEDDYYFSEDKKKSSILPMALGIAGAIFAYQPVMDFLARKTKKEEKMAETPELIENPNTGNLDPAQYEEMVVESTGYAVDVIPQGLDGSFMGSRFAALPTERYVEYNEPGIGAHTDIALDRNEMYLEPEMAMVQASESVKESQAPGQSPYNSVDGEENRDFDMRVLKETQVISLDPAVKPFIPQSMSGYTGNANTPPSVYDKMFNIGVLGQTPAFVPGSGDIGSSHTGSRSAIPNSLGIAGSVGGPLSDQVNANYTDGTTSMSLAQWAIENTVSQSSDTEAVVIDRSSGQMKRVRRV